MTARGTQKSAFFAHVSVSGFLSQAEAPFQSQEAKLHRLQRGEMEWRMQGGGGRWRWRERERGGERGSVVVAAAAAARLNGVFQGRQSSLSNRRLRNESAYLFGAPAAEMLRRGDSAFPDKSK